MPAEGERSVTSTERAGTDHPARQFATITFLRGALIAMAITLAGGMLSALYSIPVLAPLFQNLGLDLRQLRPLHTTFGSAWIFLGGISVVHRFLQDRKEIVTGGERWRLRIQVLCWAAAGAGILITLLLGIGSGREYVGFHPAFSILILVGWLCFAWNFFRVAGRGFWNQPVYVTMWGVGVLFFLYTFAEQHAYLLPGLFADPVQDLRIQWKATGTLVGSFNLLVYGSIFYVGERISGDRRYGHSRVAYALFAVGLLNSFTNFGHHTYHLPQREIVKWISFVVSMAEIAILTRAVTDLWRVLQAKAEREAGYRATGWFFAAARAWTVAILFTSILISIPPLNAIIHGTYVVVGHAMGATIGIDTMILLGALIFVLDDYLRRRADRSVAAALHVPGVRRMIVGLNVAVGAMVLWLHIAGLATGLTRMQLSPGETYLAPAWLAASSGIVFAATGAAAVMYFSKLLHVLMPPAFRHHRSDEHTEHTSLTGS